MGPGGSALRLVKKAFPDVIKNNSIDRKALGLIVYNDKKALSNLELILHPLVQEAQARFLRQCAKSRKKLVVLDIPLLFENKIERFFDSEFFYKHGRVYILINIKKYKKRSDI